MSTAGRVLWVLQPFLALAGVGLSLVVFTLARDANQVRVLDQIRALGHPLHRLPGEVFAHALIVFQTLALAAALASVVYLLYRLCVMLARWSSLRGSQSLASRLVRILDWIIRRPALIISVFVAIIGLSLIGANSMALNGQRYYFLADDAMISMRYARNLASGLGLIWNPGEAVEGYTNFLWVLLMAVPHVLGVPESHTSLVMLVLNWLMVIGMVWLLQASLRRLGVHVAWQYCILFLFVIDQNIAYWAYSGLETILTTFLVMASVAALLHRRDLWFLISLALVPLSRSDAVLVSVMLGLAFLAVRWENLRWRAVVLLALATIPAIGQFLFRLSFYGFPLPNTYYQKLSPQISNLWQLGISYSLRLIDGYLLLIPLMVAGALALDRARWLRLLALAFFMQVAYMTWTGGDAFRYQRFLTPLLPVLYLLAGYMLHRLTVGIAHPEYRLLVAGLLVVTAPVLEDDNLMLDVDSLGAELQWTLMGTTLEKNLPPTALVSVTGAGTVPYFAEAFRFVDALGLSDVHIAHLVPPTGDVWIGHNKFDFDYVYRQRRPDIVVGALGCEAVQNALARSPADRQRLLDQNARIHFSYYEIFHPDFERDYAPNPISIFSDSGTILELRNCLFVRSGSPYSDVWTVSGEPLRAAAIQFDRPFISGRGWGPAQTTSNNVSYRRIEGTSATLSLPLAENQAYQVEFRVAIDRALAIGLILRVNDQAVPLEVSFQGDGGPVVFRGVIPASALNTTPARLEFEVEEPGSAAFDWVRVSAVE